MRTLLLKASVEELRDSFSKLESSIDVANLLEVDHKNLLFYLADSRKEYKEITIKQKNGKARKIEIPCSGLYILQRKISQVLYCIYRPRICVHGFVLGKSIVTNAKVHKRKHFVLNVDLKDFFGTINFGRVRGAFHAKPFNLNLDVATILAQICCYHNHLPQGAPSSPIISNIVCQRLDGELYRLAQRTHVYYTRYADDLTFSCNRKLMPSDLVQSYEIGKSQQVTLGNALESIINANGFQVNPQKTRLFHKSTSQRVTGLTVNHNVNVRRTYIRNIRAALHSWDVKGLRIAERIFREKYSQPQLPYEEIYDIKELPRRDYRLVYFLAGSIEFVGCVKGKDSPVYLNLKAKLDSLKQRDLTPGVE